MGDHVTVVCCIVINFAPFTNCLIFNQYNHLKMELSFYHKNLLITDKLKNS